MVYLLPTAASVDVLLFRLHLVVDLGIGVEEVVGACHEGSIASGVKFFLGETAQHGHFYRKKLFTVESLIAGQSDRLPQPKFRSPEVPFLEKPRAAVSSAEYAVLHLSF